MGDEKNDQQTNLRSGCTHHERRRMQRDGCGRKNLAQRLSRQCAPNGIYAPRLCGASWQASKSLACTNHKATIVSASCKCRNDPSSEPRGRTREGPSKGHRLPPSVGIVTGTSVCMTAMSAVSRGRREHSFSTERNILIIPPSVENE
jgi:hypothetical protein